MLSVFGNLFSGFLNPLSPIHDVLDRARAGQPLFWGGAMDFNAKMRARLLNNKCSAREMNRELFDNNILPVFTDNDSVPGGIPDLYPSYYHIVCIDFNSMIIYILHIKDRPGTWRNSHKMICRWST